MKGFILLVLGIGILHCASAATHSLRYVYTATSGIPDFPEFVTVGLVNAEPISYYDSVIRRETPRQDWMAKTEGSDYWERQTQISIADEQTFKAGIDNIKLRFNQTGGVHIIQKMYGCEWDEDTGVTEGFKQYGYDGEDFVAFDLKTKTWIAPTPQAVISKHKLDRNIANNEQKKHYLTQTCIEWLKKYVDYGKSTLQRTVPPLVSLLQKTPSSPVTCHATGFYPSGVMVFWQKDGQDQHEDVENGETLHNDDGTFQKSVHLTVTPEEWKNNKYQCVVQVTGINEDFIKVLTETNRALIIGVAVALLAVVAVVVGVVIWKKKNKNKKGFLPTSTSDTDSDNSGKVVQKT
ncbi:major histocompatibility complex class I-related gene protein [Coregonus clupeaformis]|uniref:major histocompatibility complex class I-related gene protein n=1 Tax=Coregonus clupeaformis TaxID=59861 RepID=UPI001E1C7526|nr:major histocompatibility complex class I-related gene protein [Coregonus clupeaformis]